MTRTELARLVIETLNAQRSYFHESRTPTQLAYCKELERELRRAAEAALAEVNAIPGPFADAEEP